MPVHERSDVFLPKLDKRLAAIAEMVRPGMRCADIGTDHGYLIAWLAASGRISAGYACDINKKPLEKAAFSLSQYGVADRVKLLLCDGLSGLRAGDADDFAIAGMGGELIWEIISAQPWTRDPALRFLLQPMTRPHALRRSLYANGFTILREEPVVSAGFPYSIMQAAYTGECRQIDAAAAYGGLLLHDSRPEARQYIDKVVRQLRQREQGLFHSGQQVKAAEISALISILEGEIVDDCTKSI